MNIKPEDAATVEQLISPMLGAKAGGEETPTPTEAAAAAMSPADAGDKTPAVSMIKLKVGDNEREYTQDQLAGTLSRYSDLNMRHANLKPIISLAESIMEQAKGKGIDAKAEDVAKFMEAAMKAVATNPTMGGKPKDEDANPNDEQGEDDPLSAWERDNAVKLPPGYKEAGGRIKALEDALMQTNQLLNQMLQGGLTNGQQVQQAQQQVGDARASAFKQAVGANLRSIQQKYGFPDDSEQAFMGFMQERGYTMEDLIDPGMADRLGADFQAVQGQPELDRLRAIATRRQAFTGDPSASPAGGGASPDQPAGDPMLSGIINTAMRARNM